ALVAFHKRFYGAGNIEFSAVGEFDAHAVKQSLTDGLKGWQKAPAYTRLTNPYRDIPAKQFDIETPDKANAFYISRVPLQLQDTNPDFPALYLANFLLGTSETSRLWERVREREGLSYNVRSSLTASSYEPSGRWTIYAIYAPENHDRLETAINEELARAVKDSLTNKVIADGITALLNYRKLSRAQDSVLASAWIDYLSNGRTFDWSAQFDKKIEALTPESVNTALRKYLQPSTFSTAVAGDFAAHAKKAP